MSTNSSISVNIKEFTSVNPVNGFINLYPLFTELPKVDDVNIISNNPPEIFFNESTQWPITFNTVVTGNYQVNIRDERFFIKPFNIFMPASQSMTFNIKDLII